MVIGNRSEFYSGTRPEIVEGVEWEGGLSGHLTVRWDAAVRAESYVVHARNASGPGVPSDEVSATVPTLAAAA